MRTALLDASAEGAVGHIELADWPDLIIVAPATADLLARAAHGRANDLASCVLLATQAPVLWAPAMNTNMWRHPATRSNLARLREFGASFVGPDAGALACGWVGEGRMIDPEFIVDAACRLLASRQPGNPWAGRRVLVSAGPTRTYLDPVRFITNASTGSMGYALAAAAYELGADVTLVSGPVDRPSPRGVERVDVTTARELLDAMEERLSAGERTVDLVAMVAAVGDLEVEQPSAGKLGKQALIQSLATTRWRAAVDILKTLVARHGARTRFLGFAAQTAEGDAAEVERELVRLGAAKLAAKGAHALFVNRVGVPGLGFSSSTNAGHLLVRGADGDEEELEVMPSGPPVEKLELARWILERLGERLWRAA
ncbi:MAG: bifunctional phosphopantothenoylcysteine decarboxylase/phosphopantothenate--cysteine ligase CoaBC [Myxococcales bacterium]|nr:bifunctional phosphopantothenoylcysteine decarboxylase/phosphopantothenate--cysteine ligase CoaBC [Myxococcales bacterium]